MRIAGSQASLRKSSPLLGLRAGCADADHAVGHLMTVAGVRAVLRLACTATMKIRRVSRDRSRSRRISVQGLWQFQSGPMDRAGYISGCERREVEERSPRNRQCQASARSTRPSQRSIWGCAVTRRRFPVGARPTRQPLQPEATGAGMEETKCLKPSDSGSRIGDRARVQAATRVSAPGDWQGVCGESPLR
jgi:hypothetical protein